MANYLLDTNHLSPLVTPGHPVRERVIQNLRYDHTFTIATPALTEFLYGIQMAKRKRQNLKEWQQFQDVFDYRDIERIDAEQAARLQVDLRPRDWQLATVDALIAAVALRYQLTLLTSDNDFSTIPGLDIENWLPQT